MLYQQRPFFRKIIKLPSNTVGSNWSLTNSYRNTVGHKSTCHKVKKTVFMPIKPLSINYKLLKTPVVKLSSLVFNPIGHGLSACVKSAAGLTYLRAWVGSLDINTLLKVHSLDTHRILSSYNLKSGSGLVLPLTHICSRGSVFGSNSFKLCSLQKDGSLLVKLARDVTLHSTESVLARFGNKYIKPVGITSRVRGIAKNPVDHPNGGRANTKGSFQTPWGSIAKHNK